MIAAQRKYPSEGKQEKFPRFISRLPGKPWRSYSKVKVNRKIISGGTTNTISTTDFTCGDKVVGYVHFSYPIRNPNEHNLASTRDIIA